MTLKSSELSSLPDGMYNDGNGLYFRVRNQGKSRDFLYRGTLNGKQTYRSLGSLKTLSLSQARKKAKDFTIEPIAPKKTFSILWEETLREVQFTKQWKYEYQFSCYAHYIKVHLIPKIGAMKISDITREVVYQTLLPLWKTNAYQGSRTRYILEALFDKFILHGYCKINPAIWQGNLSLYLPTVKKVRKPVRHFNAASYTEIPSLVLRMWKTPYLTKYFAIFLLATCLRNKEGRTLKWAYLKHTDAFGYYLDIPAENRKGHKEHNNVVPLSDEVMQLLFLLPRTSEYIFTNTIGTLLDKDSLSKFYRVRLNLDITGHGGRSSFRVWSAENGEDYVASEFILSHNVGNETTRAYLRTSLYQKRKEILNKWSKYIFKGIDFSMDSGAERA